MSITGDSNEETIRMPGFWQTLMKLAVLLALPVFTLGSGWAIWITTTTFQHSQDIAVIQEHMKSIKSSQAGLLSRLGKIPNEVAHALKPADGE